MSYNTRRSNAGGVQGTQVSYHQAPSSAQRGGSTGSGPRPAGGGAGYASHFTGPVSYNTQPGYSSVQSKQQDQQQQQQQPQQQQQQAQQPPLPAAAKAPAPNPPAAEPAAQSGPKAEMDDSATNGATSSPAFKPAWMKKGVKVNKVLKKRRMNARLRKLLVPKNALMALNEIHPGPKFHVQEHTNALNQTVFSVRVEIDGQCHTGQSLNKTHAKQMACENALKSILVSRMQSQFSEKRQQMDTSGSEIGGAPGCEESKEDDPMTGGTPPLTRPPEDDMPWGCLASFALHKLFIDWQNQGVEIPINNAQPMAKKIPALSSGQPTQPIKKIPEDANKRHPVLMLNHLQPGLQFSERIDGVLPNAIFIFSVNIDGEEFTGSASNKKEAKKECAKAALVKFGIISEY